MIIDEGPDNVYVEGAKHYWRFHGKDTRSAASSIFIYVAVLLAIWGVGEGLVHLIALLPASHPAPHYYGHLKPANIGPTYNQFLKSHNLPNFTTPTT